VRVFAKPPHALESFTAGNAGIHQNAGTTAGDNGTVTAAAASQKRD